MRESQRRSGIARNLIRILCIGAMATPLSLAAPAMSQPESPRPSGRTIGLVLTSWTHALYETPSKAECPAGLQAGEEEQMRARKDGDEQLRRFGSYDARGPNGEASRFLAWRVEDPIPFRELQTKVGYGLNLDGTPDGRATAKSCKHEKFTSPEGEAVDNQMARVLGCVAGWRSDGFNTGFIAVEFHNLATNRVLVEITGVDSETNDPDVGVNIYKGRDKLVASAPDKYVPFLIQRIDDRFPRYTHTAHGRIVDGVLITDPIPVADFPGIWVNGPVEHRMKDLRLRLKLTDTGASGFFAGYEDLKYWWNMHGKGAAAAVGKFSQAGVYRAAHRYADGFPDPATGQCTAISTSYKVEAVRAMIPHPVAKALQTRVAATGEGRY